MEEPPFKAGGCQDKAYIAKLIVQGVKFHTTLKNHMYLYIYDIYIYIYIYILYIHIYIYIHIFRKMEIDFRKVVF